jgi:4-hydroxy-2-oxoglutarate aldolase
MEMHKLWLSGDIAGASELQIKFATCEIGFGQGGINGTKWVVADMRGYPAESAHCRRPYPQYTDEKKKAWILTKMKLCYDVESALSA